MRDFVEVSKVEYVNQDDINTFLNTKFCDYEGDDFKEFNQGLLDNLFTETKLFIYYDNELCGFMGFTGDFLHYMEIYKKFRNKGLCKYLIKNEFKRMFKKVWISNVKTKEFWNNLGIEAVTGYFNSNCRFIETSE